MVTTDFVDTAVFFATAALGSLVLALLGAATFVVGLLLSCLVYWCRRSVRAAERSVVVGLEARERPEVAMPRDLAASA